MPAFVQEKLTSGAGSGAVTTIIVTPTTHGTNGNLWTGSFGWNSTNITGLTAGSTTTVIQDNNGVNATVIDVIADGGGPVATVTWYINGLANSPTSVTCTIPGGATTPCGGSIQEWSGIASGNPLDGHNIQTSANSTSNTSPDITTSVAGDLIVGYLNGTDSGVSSITAASWGGTSSGGTGSTLRNNDASGQLADSSEIQTSAGQIHAIFTLSSAQAYQCAIAAFKAAAAGTVENYSDFKGRTWPQPWVPDTRLMRNTAQDFSSFGVETNPHWRPKTLPVPWFLMSLSRAPPQDSSSFGVETNPHWKGLTWPVQWLLPRMTLSAALDVTVPVPDTPPSYVSRMQLTPWYARPILGGAFDVSPLIATPPSYVSRFQTPPWLLNWLLYKNTAQDLSSLGVETPYSYVSAHWTPQWNLNYSLMRGTAQDFSSTPPPPTGVHIVTTMGAKFITPIGI